MSHNFYPCPSQKAAYVLSEISSNKVFHGGPSVIYYQYDWLTKINTDTPKYKYDKVKLRSFISGFQNRKYIYFIFRM